MQGKIDSTLKPSYKATYSEIYNNLTLFSYQLISGILFAFRAGQGDPQVEKCFCFLEITFVALCDLFQTPVSVDGLAVDNAADPVLEAKYRDKLFTQV